MSAVAGAGTRSRAAVGQGMTPKALWRLVTTSVAVLMVTLDNLVADTRGVAYDRDASARAAVDVPDPRGIVEAP